MNFIVLATLLFSSLALVDGCGSGPDQEKQTLLTQKCVDSCCDKDREPPITDLTKCWDDCCKKYGKMDEETGKEKCGWENGGEVKLKLKCLPPHPPRTLNEQ